VNPPSKWNCKKRSDKAKQGATRAKWRSRRDGRKAREVGTSDEGPEFSGTKEPTQWNRPGTIP